MGNWPTAGSSQGVIRYSQRGVEGAPRPLKSQSTQDPSVSQLTQWCLLLPSRISKPGKREGKKGKGVGEPDPFRSHLQRVKPWPLVHLASSLSIKVTAICRLPFRSRTVFLQALNPLREQQGPQTGSLFSTPSFCQPPKPTPSSFNSRAEFGTPRAWHLTPNPYHAERCACPGGQPHSKTDFAVLN